MTFKFYPSSSAFQWGDLTVTEYDSGCLRSIVFRTLNGIRPKLTPAQKAVGKLQEDSHDASLTEHFEREVSFQEDVNGTVIMSGRCDFLTADSVHETKGSLSKSASAVLKGKWKPSHVAQVVSYMLHFGREVGLIVFGAYKEKKDGTFEKIDGRDFTVTLDDCGAIRVDNQRTCYSVQDLLSHRYRAAALLAERRLHPVRPLNWDAKFGSPCAYCPFQSTCNAYDVGLLTDEQAIERTKNVKKI